MDEFINDFKDIGLTECGDNDLNEKEEQRPTCQGCLRPVRTCWCSWVQPISISQDSFIVILQHRNERKRQIRTAQMLVRGINNERCKVFVKSKVTSLSDAVNLSDDERLFRQLLRRPDAYVLFPTKTSQNAADIFSNVKSSNNSYVLVVIDGTWREAKKMYVRSPVLQNLPSIHLDLRVIERKSEYVVRTQPTEQCLSTVEIVAHTIEILENDPSVVEKLVAPLRALCSIQIRHGAVVHDSKEIKKDLEHFCKENTRRNPKNVLQQL